MKIKNFKQIKNSICHYNLLNFTEYSNVGLFEIDFY
jgi:hypothetical protein